MGSEHVIAKLTDSIVGAMPTLDRTDQKVAFALYHLLAEGRPVEHADVASRAGIPRRRLEDVCVVDTTFSPEAVEEPAYACVADVGHLWQQDRQVQSQLLGHGVLVRRSPMPGGALRVTGRPRRAPRCGR